MYRETNVKLCKWELIWAFSKIQNAFSFSVTLHLKPCYPAIVTCKMELNFFVFFYVFFDGETVTHNEQRI